MGFLREFQRQGAWGSHPVRAPASKSSAGPEPRPDRNYWRAGLRPCSAKACAMFSAIDFVSANEMFAITATHDPAFGKRHEVRRATDEILFAAMARHPRGLARERKRLEIPAKTVAGLRARGQPLRRLELLDGAGLQQLAAVDAHPEPHQVRRRGQERGGAGVAGMVPLARRLRPISGIPRKPKPREVERRARPGSPRSRRQSSCRACPAARRPACA